MVGMAEVEDTTQEEEEDMAEEATEEMIEEVVEVDTTSRIVEGISPHGAVAAAEVATETTGGITEAAVVAVDV